MTTPAQAGSAIRPAPLALPARASTAPIELPLQREVEVAQTWDAGSVAVDAGVAQRSADGSVVFDVASAPAVQREADDAPAASEPAPAAAAAPSAAAPGAGGQNIDDLVRRLYDPLAARIKAELWLDRERAGLVTDLRRT
jgi:hypothetical protein